MTKLRVYLQSPELGRSAEDSLVHVALRDTSLADALHPTVAEATAVATPGVSELDVELDVPEGGVDRRHRYSVWVHVDRSGQGELRPGDLISTENVPVTVDDLVPGARVEVPLSAI